MEKTLDTGLKKTLSGRKKDAIFCAIMLIYPLVHFAIFYVYVNLSSFAMAFQTYDEGRYIWDWGKTNFNWMFYSFRTDPAIRMGFQNSAVAYVCIMLISEPLSIIFSYFIYKKVKGAKFFKVVLFIPTIIPAIVMTLIYKYFTDNALPEVMKIFGVTMSGLFTTVDTQFVTVLVYNLFLGFGAKVLVYSSTMSSINESIVESAQLDGISFTRELWSITLPMIFGTITTYLVASIATFVTNQLNLYSFFGLEAVPAVQTIGYYMYARTQLAGRGSIEFTYLSAMGLFFSAIIIPVTIVLRKLLMKFGPSED